MLKITDLLQHELNRNNRNKGQSNSERTASAHDEMYLKILHLTSTCVKYFCKKGAGKTSEASLADMLQTFVKITTMGAEVTGAQNVYKDKSRYRQQ